MSFPTVLRLASECTEILYCRWKALHNTLCPTDHRQHTKLDTTHNVKIYSRTKKCNKQWICLLYMYTFTSQHTDYIDNTQFYPIKQWFAIWHTYTYHELTVIYYMTKTTLYTVINYKACGFPWCSQWCFSKFIFLNLAHILMQSPFL